MRHIETFVVVVGLTVALGSAALCAPPEREWTVMAYLGGDGSLREAAASYSTQLQQAGSTARVGVVVQLDGVGDPAASTAVRFIVGAGAGGKPTNIGLVNTGDEETLADFVKWARTVCPARKYAVLIMGHGTPVARVSNPLYSGLGASGLALDAGAGGDALTATELANGLRDGIAGSATTRFDVVFLDCCYGGCLEVAYDLADVARVLVGSPGEIYSPGLPWYRIVTRLQASPDMDGQRLSRDAIHCAVSAWAADPMLEASIVAVELGRVRRACSALGDLGRALEANTGDSSPAVTLARSQCVTWGSGGELCDAGAISTALWQISGDGVIGARALATRRAIDAAILDTYCQGPSYIGKTCGSGVAVFFPPSLSELPPEYGLNCSMARTVGWWGFLDKYLNHLKSLLTR